MCTAGQVKHHLKHTLADSRNTIIFVGYQAAGSLGRVIQTDTSPVRIFGQWYPLKARVETIEGFSAHADRTELLDWFESLDGPPQRTFLVHGRKPRRSAWPTPSPSGSAPTSRCQDPASATICRDRAAAPSSAPWQQRGSETEPTVPSPSARVAGPADREVGHEEVERPEPPRPLRGDPEMLHPETAGRTFHPQDAALESSPAY